MEQRQLPLLCRLDGPAVVPQHIVAQCRTYRDAVRMAWHLRRAPGMTKRTLAEQAGLYPPHVTCYLHEDDRKRDLPASCITAFNWAVGHTLVSQWIAWKDKLTVLEELQAGRALA